ncbi:MAG TPA: hypothetical protein ENN21_03510 [Spirochaetes bacterium]|nr:hypothetical protein [Spirochaetota bacterium]
MEKEARPDAKKETDPVDPLGRVIEAVTRSKEGAELIGRLAPEMLKAWAGDSGIKNFMATRARRSIEKGLAPGKAGGRRRLSETAAEPGFALDALALAPEAVNFITGLLDGLARGLANLPPEEKRSALEKLCARLDMSLPAGAFGTLIAVFHEINAADRDFFPERLRPLFRAWIEATDFGALRDAADTAPDTAAACARVCWEELWRYPAKVICLLSSLPVLAHASIEAALETLRPLNRLAPDLLADVVFSLLKDLDGARAARLANEFNEVMRKINTGSVLLGDEGRPAGPAEFSRLAAEFIGAFDGELYRKARAMTAETLETAEAMAVKNLEGRPDLIEELVLERFRKTGRLRGRAGRLGKLMDRGFDDAGLARLFGRGFEEAGPEEWAAALSRLCSLLNRARRASPGFAGAVFEQFISSLDEDELRETLEWCVEDIVGVLKPSASVFLPPIIRGLAELIADDGQDGEMREALALLRDALMNGEGKR